MSSCLDRYHGRNTIVFACFNIFALGDEFRFFAVERHDEARLSSNLFLSVLNWAFYHAPKKFIGDVVMELFRADKIGELESNSTKQCRVCGRTLNLIRIVYYPDREATVRVFECECGERTWDE
jgi:hypothetical protein